MNDRKQDNNVEVLIVQCDDCKCIQTRIVREDKYKPFNCVKCNYSIEIELEIIKRMNQIRIIPNGKVGQ